MKNLYDLIIIGGGPAGLSAAIYAGRSMLRVLVLDTDNAGGQIAITEDVANYPGILKTTGAALTANMREQAKNFGAELRQGTVEKIYLAGDIKKITTTDKTQYQSLSVIIATGARPRTLGFQGEKEFTGRGVAYCATCDGEFFSGMDIFVIGGGFAAAEEAIFLTRFAKKVHMIIREPDFTCAAGIAQKVRADENIQLYFESEVEKVEGDSVVRSATIKNNKTGESWQFKPESPNETFGVFVFVGYEPISELFKNQIELDEYGYIPSNQDMQTNIEGVYAAGDIRPKRLRQLVTAVSDGAIASTSIERFVDIQKSKLNVEVQAAEHKETEEKPVESFLDEDLVAGLKPILERLERPAVLKVVKSAEKEKVSSELETFAKDIAELSDKITVEVSEGIDSESALLPMLTIEDANDYGIYFHGVPSGHEFNSFVLALYNIAGPGQKLEDSQLERIKAIKPTKIYIGATLSCTMCPDVVQATQLIARHNKGIEAHMVDISHFPKFKEAHNLMSVPAMVIDGKQVVFGRKNIDEIIELLS